MEVHQYQITVNETLVAVVEHKHKKGLSVLLKKASRAVKRQQKVWQKVHG